MKCVRRAFLCSLGLLLTGAARGADGWAQLKAGMTADEAKATLGDPLFANEGHGFAVWIYDAGTEVVFYDRVIAWTAPVATRPDQPLPATWSFFQGAPGQTRAAFPVRQRVARAAAAKAAAEKAAALVLATADYSAFRYQPRR